MGRFGSSQLLADFGVKLLQSIDIYDNAPAGEKGGNYHLPQEGGRTLDRQKDASFVLTNEVSLLRVCLVCLQWGNAKPDFRTRGTVSKKTS